MDVGDGNYQQVWVISREECRGEGRSIMVYKEVERKGLRRTVEVGEEGREHKRGVEERAYMERTGGEER